MPSIFKKLRSVFDNPPPAAAAGAPAVAAAAPEPPPAPKAPPTMAQWLAGNLQLLDFAGPAELRLMDKTFSAIEAGNSRVEPAKEVIRFFTQFPEKARWLCGSGHYFVDAPDPVASRLAFLAGNFALGQADRCERVMDALVREWPGPFTSILLSRVRGECHGLQEEMDVLRAAQERYPEDLVVRLSLIEALISQGDVDGANAAVGAIRDRVEKDLADEIITARQSQAQLERAIADGTFAPEAGDDIYTDEVMRNYWVAYYESFVTRREHQHGDRLLLNRFLAWAEAMKDEVDVVLDFGVLCAQNLYEAALRAPHIRFIGTDRQEFIATMNAAAYPLPNLSFEHGDIFAVLERVGRLPGRKALVHIRTTCTLYPKFVQELYGAAARHDFRHVFLIENAGFVRTQLKFFPFEAMPAIALATKHRLVLHDYKKQLADAGYGIAAFSRLRAPGLWRGEHPANYLGSQYEIHALLARS